jgi:hypothetical protein
MTKCRTVALDRADRRSRLVRGRGAGAKDFFSAEGIRRPVRKRDRMVDGKCDLADAYFA